jgi:hypothetical protein
LQPLANDLREQKNEILAAHAQSASLTSQQIGQSTDLMLRSMEANSQAGIGAIMELRETMESVGNRIETTLIAHNTVPTSRESLFMALSSHRRELMNLNWSMKQVPHSDLLKACSSDSEFDGDIGLQMKQLNRQFQVWSATSDPQVFSLLTSTVHCCSSQAYKV